MRLRDWLGVDETTFYDARAFAIAPMAFCFPGYDGSGPTGRGGDRPPPALCASTWRHRFMALLLPQLRLVELVGTHAQNWHRPDWKRLPISDRVRMGWQSDERVAVALPHPSWRNSGWLRQNPWFEAALVPQLRAAIAEVLSSSVVVVGLGPSRE